MPLMKLNDDDFDPEELDVDYETGKSYTKYDGEIARTGTILSARVAKGWWTESADGDPMLKIVVEAEQNEGDDEEYDGMPAWENLVFKPSAAFKYGPFLEFFGITLKDIKKKMMVEKDDDPKNGTPIISIGGWKFGSDDALCRYVVSRERYKGKWQAHVQEWLPWDEADEEPEEEEEAPRRRKPAAEDNGRRPARTPAASRRRAEPEPDEDEPDDDEPEEETPRSRRTAARRPAARSGGTATRTRDRPAARASGSSRTTRSRSDDEGYDDEPPF
jgi:hypothetical protein